MLYRIPNEFGLTECFSDPSENIVVGIESQENIVALVNGKHVCRVPIIRNSDDTVQRAVRVIIGAGGAKAAKEIGFWTINQHSEFLEMLINLHYIYMMPEETHLQMFMRKNPNLVILSKKLDLTLVKSV